MRNTVKFVVLVSYEDKMGEMNAYLYIPFFGG
jgi:hypothetical protein